MNTFHNHSDHDHSFHDLEHEFTRLSADVPDEAGLRSAVTAGVMKREKRRRTAALIGVAGAVVLVIGGVAVTRALTASAPNSLRPAAPSVVSVPDVPLPADTQLVRHQLQTVTSPVSVTPPDGLTGTVWTNMPGRLAAWWYSPTSPNGASNDSAPRLAGYVVTDSADDKDLTFNNAPGATTTVDSEPITVGGHSARLESASADANDKMGLPATQRISWQLADGRYIRVFTDAPVSKDGTADPALLAFAASVAEKPSTLVRTVGIGLTLPGLTEDLTTNASPVAAGTAGSILLCPAGYDPYAQPVSESGTVTVSGSSSAPVDPSTTVEAGGAAAEITADPNNPLAPCITVFLVNMATISATMPVGTSVTVAGTTVQVDTGSNTARTTLASGLLIGVAAPATTPLSQADLAALAASVRLSPDVEVLDPGLAGVSEAEGLSSSSEAVGVSSSALPADPSDPSVTGPLVVLRDGQSNSVDIASEPGARKGTVTITLANATDQPATINSITVGSATVDGETVESPGVTLEKVQARLDNVPADADSPMADFTFPTMLAPQSQIRLELTFAVGQCSELVAPDLPVDLEYRTDIEFDAQGGSSSSGGSVNLAAQWGIVDWVDYFKRSFCG